MRREKFSVSLSISGRVFMSSCDTVALLFWDKCLDVGFEDIGDFFKTMLRGGGIYYLAYPEAADWGRKYLTEKIKGHALQFQLGVKKISIDFSFGR
jgi:hypothetical protein